MLQPHVIRLRGPWEYEPLERWQLSADGSIVAATEPLPSSGRMTMPADWGETLGRDFRGRVRFLRRFSRPTNLEPHERVWLACDGVDLQGTVWLNEQLLGRISGNKPPARFDITSLLTDRNQLVLEVDLPPLSYQCEQSLRPSRAGLPGGVIGEVRLEIEG